MASYNQILNAHALMSITKPPQIPDYHLMIGTAEELSPVPLLLYSKAFVSSEIVKNMTSFSEMDNEDIAAAIADGSIEVNDINLNISTMYDGIGVI